MDFDLFEIYKKIEDFQDIKNPRLRYIQNSKFDEEFKN